ncbi:hypothetical protein [Flavobacterium alvei]|uniref:hypothetical protein n=1 Tax=Flavobacterium alvei TaxID=2080416 RepID=UPI0026EC1F6E|nr:hypothetical protein [Flavobacterium alvei]
MKKINKLALIVITGVICFFVISFNINLILNKKYAVDEIPFTTRKQGLIGVQEIISLDYLYMIYLNIFFVVLLIGFALWMVFNNNNKKI